ncbi:restriction endonuclease subunit S [Rickettsia sibirica]|uniref:Type I restriction enzyme S subunit n=1 Tax=Rickettsia sibirica (strain ATCC VR-151 / 246) TaxID=272951 RepID=Q7PA86_RICS2|nr:restriction endonuclease subunit S [Rickettsia sibirica]EAA25951.1 putative type I restriction enzyme S subunit [Rickettsia sibirica 246]
MNSYQKIIEGAKQIIDNWHPYFEINKQWEIVKFGDIVINKLKSNILSLEHKEYTTLIVGKKGKMININTAIKGDIPVIASGRVSPYSHNQYNFNGNIITISSSGAYAGYIWYHNSPMWTSDCNVIYSINEKLLLTKYLYYILKSQQNIIYQKQAGSGQPHVYLKDLEDLQIPIPPLEEQQKMVTELDNNQSKIDNLKNYIKQFENKLKTTLNSLWQ